MGLFHPNKANQMSKKLLPVLLASAAMAFGVNLSALADDAPVFHQSPSCALEDKVSVNAMMGLIEIAVATNKVPNLAEFERAARQSPCQHEKDAYTAAWMAWYDHASQDERDTEKLRVLNRIAEKYGFPSPGLSGSPPCEVDWPIACPNSFFVSE